MKLKKNGIVYKIYAFTLDLSEGWRLERTNLCHLFWHLVQAPFVGILAVIVLTVLLPFMAIAQVVEKIGERTEDSRLKRGPSKIKLWWEMFHGKICPIVDFE